jgi:hypothetical protein
LNFLAVPFFEVLLLPVEVGRWRVSALPYLPVPLLAEPSRVPLRVPRFLEGLGLVCSEPLAVIESLAVVAASDRFFFRMPFFRFGVLAGESAGQTSNRRAEAPVR